VISKTCPSWNETYIGGAIQRTGAWSSRLDKILVELPIGDQSLVGVLEERVVIGGFGERGVGDWW